MPPRPRRGAPAALVLCLLLWAAPVTAQTPDGRASAGPEIAVSGSTLTPVAPLTRSDVSFDTEVSSALAASGALTWWLGPHTGISARGIWAPAELNIRGVPGGAAVPDDLGDADYLAGTLELAYRFLPGGAAAMLEPFLSAGVGVRDLELDPVAAPEARSATDPAATVAAGSYVRIWDRTALRIELRDLVSEFDAGETEEGELQHDIFISVGLSYRP